MVRIVIPEGAFVIRRRNDGMYVLSYGNLLIVAERTYQSAFNAVFSGKTGVVHWDNLANKHEMYQLIHEVSVEEEA